LTIAAGQIERWRIVNASSARYVRLSLGGLPFRIIGTDGGLIEAPVTAEEVLLPAADRVELAVGPSETDGDVLNIEDLPYNRLAGKKGVERFGTIRVAPRKPSTARVPERLREIAPLVSGDAPVTRTVKLWIGRIKRPQVKALFRGSTGPSGMQPSIAFDGAMRQGAQSRHSHANSKRTPRRNLKSKRKSAAALRDSQVR